MARLVFEDLAYMDEHEPLMDDTFELSDMFSDKTVPEEGLEELCVIRKDTVQRLYDEADELDKLAKDIQITNATAAAGGIVAIGLTVAGFVGAFVTFGASIPLGISGAILGTMSAATAASANIIDKLISNKRQDEINAALKRDREALDKYVLRHNLRIYSDQLINADDTLNGFAVLGRSTVAATSASNVTVTVLRVTCKAVPICGLVFSILTLPLDIGILVKNSIDIHNGKPHELAKHFRDIATKLAENVKEDIIPLLETNY